jgi:hypothetical protein
VAEQLGVDREDRETPAGDPLARPRNEVGARSWS